MGTTNKQGAATFSKQYLGSLLIATMVLSAEPLVADTVILDCDSLGGFKLENSWLPWRSTVFYVPEADVTWTEGCRWAKNYSIENNVAACSKVKKISYRRDNSRIAGIAGGNCANLGFQIRDNVEVLVVCKPDQECTCDYEGGYKVPVIERRDEHGIWHDLRLGEPYNCVGYDDKDDRCIYEEVERLSLPDYWTVAYEEKELINFDLYRYSSTSTKSFHSPDQELHSSQPSKVIVDCERVPM